MTGSASNITTQWTFRDGREYVLSLTNTETPNTVSFWVSDQITGEEWTGCYDENCIEVLTKRTGCYKNFPTFLSMIKSAILKKSDSVILELLNIQDLAAISVHRQATASTESGNGIQLNFELYSSDMTVNSKSSSSGHQQNPRNVHSTENNTSNSNNGIGVTGGSHKLQPPSNKRKYLIVSYIGEFDKVHYPLPLNYSNPPDLNVMQNNILKLKAEVTSLKSTKKELEDHLKAIKLSSVMPQHSHENSNDVNNNIDPPLCTSNSTCMMRKEQVFVGHNSSQQQTDINGNHEEPLKVDHVFPDGVRKLDLTASSTCIKCCRTIEKLLETIRDVENASAIQREEYLQCIEKFEKENRLLRHKVDASEKYEMGLWNQIKELQEKLEMEQLAKERELKALKDAHKTQFRQSRHDVFYNMRNRRDSNFMRKLPSKSPVKTHSKFETLDLNRGRTYAKVIQHSRSNSNSTASYSSGGRNSKENIYRRNQSENNYHRSRSSSSYHTIKLPTDPRSRVASLSPVKRFDPTAYIAEKKMKQSKIANLRMKKIESRFRPVSAGSRMPPCRSPSPAPSGRSAHLTRTTVSPSTLYERVSGEMSSSFNVRKQNTHKMETCLPNKSSSHSKSFKDRLERSYCRSNSRPSSADSFKTKIISTGTNFRFNEKGKEKSKTLTEKKEETKHQAKIFMCDTSNSLNAPTFTNEYSNRIQRTPAKKPIPDTQKMHSTNNKAINTSFTCNQLEPLVAIGEKSKFINIKKAFAKGQSDKKDISFLQEKLSALNAYLETCKPK